MHPEAIVNTDLVFFIALFPLLFGIVGWYQGELQHGHTGFSDGGLLTAYNSIAARGGVNVGFLSASSLAAVNIDNTLPAGSLGVNRSVRIIVLGDWLNNTGVAAAPPQVSLLYGGTSAATFFTATTLAASPTAYSWMFEVILSEIGGVTNSQQGFGRIAFMAGFGGAVALENLVGRNNAVGGGFAIDSTIDQILRVSFQNQVNNANYQTRVNSVTIELL